MKKLLTIFILLSGLQIGFGQNAAIDSTSTEPFKSSVTFALDIFPLDLEMNLCFNVDRNFSLGLEGGVGVNLSHYFLVAGEHFSKGSTLIKYEPRDRYDGERYAGLLNFSIFGRFFPQKRHSFDIGILRELFLHVDDSDDDFGDGEFTGGYVKYFIPTKWKEKNGKFKKRNAFGIKVAAGQFKESASLKEFGVMTSFWIRVFFNYNKR